jgi:hypothetical protein
MHRVEAEVAAYLAAAEVVQPLAEAVDSAEVAAAFAAAAQRSVEAASAVAPWAAGPSAAVATLPAAQPSQVPEPVHSRHARHSRGGPLRGSEADARSPNSAADGAATGMGIGATVTGVPVTALVPD